MIDKHIKFNPDLLSDIEKLCDSNGLKLSEGVRNLVEVGMNNVTVTEIIETNNKLLYRVYGRLGYLVDLVEQFYADMDIDNHVDVKNSKSIKNIRLKRSDNRE